MKTSVAQIWPGEREKKELPFSEEPQELVVLAQTWKDLKKAEQLSSSTSHEPGSIYFVAFAAASCAVLYLWRECCIFWLNCL